MMPENKIEIYQTEDGKTDIQVRFEQETIWLSQAQLSEFFGRSQPVISRHINNALKEGEINKKSNMQKMHIANSDKPILLYDLDVVISTAFADHELEADSVIRNFRITAADSKSYNTKYYNLTAIVSVGYKVNSEHAVQFRKWAITVIEAFTIKGFAMDDERLKSDSSARAIKRNPPRHTPGQPLCRKRHSPSPRRVLSGIHFSHGFPIKPSEMTVSRMRRKTEHFLGGVA